MSNSMPVMAGKNPPPPRWRPHGYPCPVCERMTLRWHKPNGLVVGKVSVECINSTCRRTFTRAEVTAR